MELEDIYNALGKYLWSIMPDNAEEIIYQYMFYPEYNQGGAYWLDKNRNANFFDILPTDIYKKLAFLLEKLSKTEIFNQCSPNHFYISLRINGEFDIQFAYIEEEDSWSGLYMRGISELTEDELDEYYIPKEIWEERIKQRK